MSSRNTAAWLREPKTELSIGAAEMHKPGPGEVLIENCAVAINPVDWMNQDGLYPPKSLPAILGNDLAGKILQVGEGVTSLSPNQRILAHTNSWFQEDQRYGPFQRLVIAPAASTCPIPDDMGYAEAASLPLSISTAAIALFGQEYFNLPPPTHKPAPSTRALLVWGASSSVGTAVVQLANAARLKVLAVTSAKNTDLVYGLGAAKVYDYHSTNVVDDIVNDLQQYELIGAYDGEDLVRC